MTKAIAGKDTVDAEVLDQVEDALIGADVGVETTVAIIKRIEERVAKDKYIGTAQLNGILQEEIMSMLTDAQSDEFATFDTPPRQTSVRDIGSSVNGVGKQPRSESFLTT